MLLRIADHVNEAEGYTFVGLTTLAREMGVTRRTATSIFAVLLKSNELNMEQRPGRTSLLFILTGTILDRTGTLANPSRVSPPTLAIPSTYPNLKSKNKSSNGHPDKNRAVRSHANSQGRQKSEAKRKSPLPPFAESGTVADLFKRFWAAYPKKQYAHKSRAWASFQDQCTGLTKLNEILEHLEKDKATWKGLNERFIPQAARWLFNKPWKYER
jgi:hypothetical protein